MEHVISKCSSPFEFFRKLTDKLPKELDKMSQHECRLILIEHLDNDTEALQRLALDTLICENKNPPESLCGYYTEDPKSIINSYKEKFKCYNTNNLHIYSFEFDKNNYYIIDRTKHTVYITKRCIE